MGNTQYSLNQKSDKNEELNLIGESQFCRINTKSSRLSTKARSIESDLSKSTKPTQKSMHRFQWLGQAKKAFIVGNFKDELVEVTFAMEYSDKDKSFYIEIVKLNE